MDWSLFPLVTVIISFLATTTVTSEKHYVSNFEKPAYTDISDFSQLVVNDVFVDKSLFVEACVKESGTTNRFLRPEGWGKTTNLDMLRRFLELEVDEEGQPIAEDRKINRKFFVGSKIVGPDGSAKELKPLRISQSKEAMAVQGRYPVIVLNFANVTGSTYAEVEKSLGESMSNLFRKRAYLRNVCNNNNNNNNNNRTMDNKDEIVLFDAYSSGIVNRTMLVDGLNFLGELLLRRFQKKPYVLIDDYDRPLNCLFLSELRKNRRIKSEFKTVTEKHIFYYAGMSEEVQDTLTLLQELLEQKMKLNQHVQNVFMTGLHEFQLVEFKIGGVHDPPTYNLLNLEKYFEFFGFTDDDIDRLLSPDRLSVKPDRTKLYEWYGYNVTGGIAYNPRSVRRFLANGCVFDNYWTRNNGTSLYDIVAAFRKDDKDDKDDEDQTTVAEEVLLSDIMQKNLQQLAEGRTVVMGLRRRVEFSNVIRDASALVPAGYLNVRPYSYRALVNFTAANREVRTILTAKMITWVCRKLNATLSDFREMADRLLAFEVEQFEIVLRRLMSAFPKYVFPWDAEVCYDGLMKSLLYSFSAEYRRRSDRNSIVVLGIPEVSLTAILVAYQAVEEPEDLQREIERGRNGTDNPNNELLPEFDVKRYPHIDRLLRLNITFCKKSFHVIYDIQRRLQQRKTTSAWIRL